MNTSLESSSLNDVSRRKVVASYLLHSERAETCDLLLRRAEHCHQPESLLDDTYAEYKALQKRLRLIDDALDRLTSGCYGACTVCRKELEAEELQADLALTSCSSCVGSPAPNGNKRIVECASR